MATRIRWGVLAAIYVAFFLWYTPLGGPLDAAEIDRYIGRLEARGADADQLSELRAFFEADTGDDFVMVNLIEMNDPPTPTPGIRENENAGEVLDRYMAYMWPALLGRACHPVVVADAAAVALDVWGIEGAARWSRAALMRYRSRRDLAEIASNPDFQGPHAFKIAAIAKTIAFPADPWYHAGDPRLLLALLLGLLGLLADRPGRRASR